MAAIAPDVPAVEMQIIEMTNAYRAKHSLGAVKRNAMLDKAARDYALYLGKTKQFSHEADGRAPGQRAQSAGYSFCQISENLALAIDSRGFSSDALAKQSVDGWIGSPGHRKNLLAPHVTDIGVAVVRAPDRHPKYISVQLFGRPVSATYGFRITNAAPQTVSYSFAGETHQIGPRYTVRHESCEPGEIAFVTESDWLGWNKVESRYQASDGQAYVLTQDDSGAIRVKLERSADKQK